MKWISKNQKWNKHQLIIVTDGNNIGYIRPCEFESFEYDKDGYIQGIPDSNSHAMKYSDIKYWLTLPEPPTN